MKFSKVQHNLKNKVSVFLLESFDQSLQNFQKKKVSPFWTSALNCLKLQILAICFCLAEQNLSLTSCCGSVFECVVSFIFPKAFFIFYMASYPVMFLRENAISPTIMHALFSNVSQSHSLSQTSAASVVRQKYSQETKPKSIKYLMPS